MKKDNFKTRVRLIYFSIFLFGVIIVGRLFFLQIIDSQRYKEMGNNQYSSSPSAEYFDRGAIYFTEKNGSQISAAVMKKGFQLAIKPSLIDDADSVYQKLSSIIALDKDDFIWRASKKDDPYEIVAKRLNDNEVGKIKDLNIKGINTYSEMWRYYPANNLASRVLGFIGNSGQRANLEGCYGLEKYYNDFLKRDDEKIFVNSFAEIFSGIKKSIGLDQQRGDIVLTIEPTVQSMLEKTLEKTAEKYEAKMAGGIIIEPKTGKILAMAVKPDFNPNFYSQYDDFSVFMNPIVENVFEMGSIMKPLTLAAAIDQGKITADTLYDDKGYLIIDKARIENYDGKARGIVLMQEVLNQSLNTGAVFAMEKLGKEKFGEYLVDYGFGDKTGIDLPQEVSGMLANVLESPREIEYATASFGQGMAVTPIEMVSALSALANGGFLMRPYVVQEMRVNGGADKKIEPQITRQVLKKETSEDMSRMLAKVFDEALMGGIYKMDHYTAAAKTGTAQFNQEGEKGYQEGRYIHTFFGYTPAFDARFLTFLFLVDPHGVLYASHSLSEPFVNITKFLLNYYEVPPDR